MKSWTIDDDLSVAVLIAVGLVAAAWIGVSLWRQWRRNRAAKGPQ